MQNINKEYDMVKEIWCMMHSHLDIGYTHPQPLLMELQVDYLTQAMELIEQTKEYPEESRYRWTVEANCVLEKWLETATKEQVTKLKEYIGDGSICVTALPMHTTPGCNARELVMALLAKGRLEKELGITIHTAINHDVNGQPWPLGGLLLDAGVDFYLTGINIHFGGIPFARPALFDWELADKRKLRTFLGEHYSLFSQFMFTHEHSVERMHEGVKEYVGRLSEMGYPYEFAFLTATNPPLYDNNCPDRELADLIRQYNEEGHEQKIRIVTADMLRERVLKEPAGRVAKYAGDWTDYWNFGSGSTARETRVSRLAKQTLEKAEFLECLTGRADRHYERVKEECQNQILLFDEHTWGASQSVKEPDDPETTAQRVHKFDMAYTAADLAGYLLANRMEALNGNPWQSNALFGITLTNTSGAAQMAKLCYPKSYRQDCRQLSAIRSKSYVPYIKDGEETESAGWVNVPPFTHMEFSFDKIQQMQEEAADRESAFSIGEGCVETPYYRVLFEKETGRIYQLYSKELKADILDEGSGYYLFDPVRETVDGAKNPAQRATLFPRDVDLGNRSISQWNHGWKAKRERAGSIPLSGDLKGSTCDLQQKAEGDTEKTLSGGQGKTWHLEEGDGALTFSVQLFLEGLLGMQQEITFYTHQPNIRMEVSFRKEPVYEPESIYFVLPLRMESGWQCSYDTAGEIVELDEEQLGAVCRDWVTVDRAISVYGGGKMVTLACPDAPLVQVGDFRFGRESRSIVREENPLLLAWAMNNYWDTNFFANQQGAITLAYELNVHGAFKKRLLWEDGVHAAHPVVMGALASQKGLSGSGMSWEKGIDKSGLAPAKEIGKSLLSIINADKAGTVLLAVYPSPEHDGIYVLAKNLRDEPELATLCVHAFPVAGASFVTPFGKEGERIKADCGRVFLAMPARALRLLKITEKIDFVPSQDGKKNT
ncbi:MAG: hypothetical protein K2N63_09690 [Lachnospiraceae bacterium]|nr:hypothetical protein [Lachnospiraceae bacterium]